MTRLRPFTSVIPVSIAPALILALLAWAPRLVYSGFTRVAWGDEPSYLWLGRNWFQGAGFSFAFTGRWDYHHTPGYPFITAVLNLLTGDLKRASEWSFIIFGIVLTLAIYALARRIYGERSALAAGVLAATLPATALMPLYWGTMTELPFMGLALAAAWMAHRAYRRFQARDVVAAGLLLAAAYYVRPEAIIYTGVIGLLLGLRALAGARAPVQALRRLLYPALLGVVFLLAILPYLIQVYRVTGTWTVSQKVGAHFATAEGLTAGSFQRFDRETWGLDSTGDEVLFFSSETATASAFDFIRADPAAYVRSVYGSTRKFLDIVFSDHLLPLFLLPFVGLAWFGQRWDRRRVVDEFYLGALLLPGLSFVLFLVMERYVVSVMPVLIIWAGRGLAMAGDWLAESVAQIAARGTSRAHVQLGLRWAPIVLVAALLLVWTPRQAATATNIGSTRPAHLLAAEALIPLAQAENRAPGAGPIIVMSRYNGIAFHAGLEWVPTPAAELPAVLNFARHKGAQFWAVDAVETRVLRPQFAPLIDDPTHPPAGLAYLTQVDDGQGPVILFRILP